MAILWNLASSTTTFAGGLSLEEAIAGLYGNRASDLHRVDDHTVANDMGAKFFHQSNCIGGLLGIPQEDTIASDWEGKTKVHSEIAVSQEIHFDQITPSKTRIEKVASDLPYTKIVIEGPADAHVMCNNWRSGKRDCINNMEFGRDFPSGGSVDLEANRQLADRSMDEILKKLCPAKR